MSHGAWLPPTAGDQEGNPMLNLNRISTSNQVDTGGLDSRDILVHLRHADRGCEKSRDRNRGSAR